MLQLLVPLEQNASPAMAQITMGLSALAQSKHYLFLHYAQIAEDPSSPVTLGSKDTMQIVSQGHMGMTALCRCLLAADFMDQQEPLMLLMESAIHHDLISDTNRLLQSREIDAAVHCVAEKSTRHGAVKDEHGFLAEVMERAAPGGLRIGTYYYFRAAAHFISAGMKAVRRSVACRRRPEVAYCLNELILEDKRIAVLPFAESSRKLVA